MSARRAAVPVIAALAAGAAVALSLADVGGIPRHVVVLAFLLLGPGLAVVGLLGLRDPVAEWTIALALSVVIDGLVAGIGLYAHAWSPERTLVIVAALTVACCAVQLARAAVAPRPARPAPQNGSLDGLEGL
ncbi:MAG: hypothetical protein U0T02_00810 [Solirubrobacteraceae bacterium]